MDICKQCGHSHETWPAEAAKCNKKQVDQLKADLAVKDNEIMTLKADLNILRIKQKRY